VNNNWSDALLASPAPPSTSPEGNVFSSCCHGTLELAIKPSTKSFFHQSSPGPFIQARHIHTAEMSHLKSMAATPPERPTRCVSSGVCPPPIMRRGHSTVRSSAACLTPGSTTIVSPGLQARFHMHVWGGSQGRGSGKALIFRPCVQMTGIKNLVRPWARRFVFLPQ